MSMTAVELEEDQVIALTADPSVAGEALRYFLASLAALALDAALLWAGVRGLALAPWTAGAFSYAAGLVLVYLLSVRWVFATRAVGDHKREFFFFAVLGIVGLLLNSTTLFIATGVGLPLALAKALSAGVGFVANFVSRKILLFSTPPA